MAVGAGWIDASRRAVPMLELLRMNLELAQQRGDAPD